MIKLDVSICRICGKPKDRYFQKEVCDECNNSRPAFKMARSPYIYEGTLKEAIHKFKFSSKKRLGRSLGTLLSDYLYRSDIPIVDIDCIIPVPLSQKRENERGYNQSFIIAEKISQAIDKPIDANILVKIKDLKRQHALGREERFLNIKGSFKCKYNQYKDVLLVDDIYTTGATVREASAALKESGILNIYVLTLARAVELP